MTVKSGVDGYKMYIGGVGFILWGLSDILLNVYSPNHPINWEVTIGKFITGWTIIGGRSALGKMEKPE